MVVLGVAGVSGFTGLEPGAIALIAFALSFSSTVFAVKILEEKGEMYSLYGGIAIGILIIQDIAAVLFLAVSTGKIPSLWAFSLLLLIPARRLLQRMLEHSGHGELQVLFGLTLALGGAQVFEMAGIKGDLGALILGVLLASHDQAGQLARQLLGFKDLFLVGFFLSIGLSGPLDWGAVGVGFLLILLVPFKLVLFFMLLTQFKLRVRTSMLTSLGLANYSEFGLIVAAVGAANGWIGYDWLITIAVTVSLSFIFAAPLNAASHTLYARLRSGLLRFESKQRIEEEQAIVPGDTAVMVFGMGRVGTGAYDVVAQRLGTKVLGVDMDTDTVNAECALGRRVIRGSAIDPDFWGRIDLSCGRVRLVLLAMPSAQENLFAVQQLRKLAYTGKVAAVAKYPDEVEMLKDAGADAAFNLYAEAGAGFADHVCAQLLPEATG
jgi:predicted Kef-type K+ transport protein